MKNDTLYIYHIEHFPCPLFSSTPYTKIIPPQPQSTLFILFLWPYSFLLCTVIVFYFSCLLSCKLQQGRACGPWSSLLHGAAARSSGSRTGSGAGPPRIQIMALLSTSYKIMSKLLSLSKSHFLTCKMEIITLNT